MPRLLYVLILGGLFTFGTPGYAHHSFAATYFEDQSVTIEGEMVVFLYRNPHSFVQVMVKEKDGTMTRYSVEWGGTGQLSGQGVTRETLKPGDYVIIQGNPGRNPADHKIRMVNIRRPQDGLTWGDKPGQVVD
jgi:hypothetical protein